MHLVIAGLVIQTFIKVAHPVVKSLKMLIQPTIAMIGLVMRVTKRVDKVV